MLAAASSVRATSRGEAAIARGSPGPAPPIRIQPELADPTVVGDLAISGDDFGDPDSRGHPQSAGLPSSSPLGRVPADRGRAAGRPAAKRSRAVACRERATRVAAPKVGRPRHFYLGHRVAWAGRCRWNPPRSVAGAPQHGPRQWSAPTNSSISSKDGSLVRARRMPVSARCCPALPPQRICPLSGRTDHTDPRGPP